MKRAENITHSAFSLLNARLVTADAERSAPLHLLGGRIVAGAPAGAVTVDLSGHLLLPGLINAHDHLQLNSIPPLPAGPPFPNSYAWMQAFQPHFARPDVAAAAAVPRALRLWQGGLKNLLAGATCVQHHDPWHPALADPHFPVLVSPRFGWCHSLGLAPDMRGRPVAFDSLAAYGPPAQAGYAGTPPDAPWLIHLSEGTDRRAAAELAALDAIGCLGPNTLLIHAVGLAAAEQELALARGAGLIWCPASNLRLLGRTLSPARAHAARRLAIGSDSRISGAPDLLAELRVAAAQSELPPAELLRMATASAAGLLRAPELGGLAPGQRADLLLLADGGGDPRAALLAARRADLRAVLRAGRPAICDPDLGPWMVAAGGDPLPVRLDGRPKLIDRPLLGPPGAAALEPGLERTDD
jgi:hypothetical protein